jgi:crotonobetainyl-CoA:carnitine CoA-transferase CaiB-like acyl-CoA transferase
VTVLEFGHIVAGPFCTLLLADLGADVIKVEHPGGGDAVRGSSDLGNSSFNYVNRDKRILSLDLKAEAGQAVLGDLLGTADVLVENFAPGTPERLGIDYASLAEDYPGLVYCSIKGFGEGPYEDYPALDPVAEALSGLMSVTGNPGQPPVRSGTSVADMAAGLYGALAVLGALRQRDRTGAGQKVTAPLFESTVALMGYWIAYAQTTRSVPGPLGASHPNWAPYDVFETADGRWVFVGPSNDRQWRALCEALEPSLQHDDRFRTLEDRRAHGQALRLELSGVISTWDTSDLVETLRGAGVPVAPVNDVSEVTRDLHLHETGAFTSVRTVEGPERRVDVPRFPVRSSTRQATESTDPPRLGEHTDSVLADHGYSAQDIDRLRAGGVI